MGCSSSRQIDNDGQTPPVRSTNNANSTRGGGGGGGGNNGDANASSSSQGLVNNTGGAGAGASTRRTSHSTRNNDASTRPDGRPNQPLAMPAPVVNSPLGLNRKPWTMSHLRRQREEYFETRVTGSPEVWEALRVICDMLRAGDLAGAQGMLDATDLTCPTGRVVGDRASRTAIRAKRGGVFDSKGELYDVPGWIVATPDDTAEDSIQEEENEKDAQIAGEGGIGGMTGTEDANLGEMVKVKARLSGKEMDVVVNVGYEQKVAVLVSKIQEMANVRKVRLAHCGKMLSENERLSATGWTPGQVLNAFVFE